MARTETATEPSGGAARKGRIHAIRGAVVDVRFPGDAPGINTRLLAGPERDRVIEVASLLDRHTVRGLLLNPARRVALGMEVIDTGAR